ncbi:MAG: hypothetical protein KF878_23245, partial [Planctomycetes bacterium]|nr:hypothetical protein [Planctomycetota bacterium]
FRAAGDGPEAREAARRALERNAHVRTFLTGGRRLPDDLAGRVLPGEPLEAALYVLAQGGAWRATAGAVPWLAAQPLPAEPVPKLPHKLRDRLRALPQVADETWQLGWRRVPRWVEGPDGARTRPWLALAVAVPREGEATIVAAEMALDAPSHQVLFEALMAGLRRPREGEPRRPGRVEVRAEAEVDALGGPCEALGIVCAAGEAAAFTAVVEARARRMLAEAQEEPGALASLPPERARRLVEAAAALYRAAPWEALGDDRVVRVAAGDLEGFGVVLGAAGLTYGVVAARDREGLHAFQEGGASAGSGAAALLFEAPDRLTLADLEAIEAAGALAAEDAYPLLTGLTPAGEQRPPDDDEVRLLEALVRGLPGLVPTSGATEVAVTLADEAGVVQLALDPG